MNLRTALRDDLRAEHEQLDDLMGEYDLTTEEGLRALLTCHYGVWSRIDGKDPKTKQALSSRCEALSADLAVLGSPVEENTEELLQLNDDAINYMASGAQLGTVMLSKQWKNADNPTVLAAHHFFDIPTNPGQWRELCAKLSEIPKDSDYAKEVLEDALRIYKLFEVESQAFNG